VNEAIQGVFDRFESAPHRRKVVATRDGVTWVDDSKATNPHAARSAGAAYPSVVLIAGGRNKGLELGGIAGPSVRSVIAYGEAGPEIARSVTAPVATVETLQDAVSAASAEARRGDTVLLAPGCASFDQFSSYAERGDVFAALVHGLDGGAKS
jgi:UDP-N-acetylmuramoylalanine--D-glutamate ligase